MPGLRYTAGLFGDCSDVLGLDDEVSRDHGWGPRCQLLLPGDDFDRVRAALDGALARRLPLRFRGFATSFSGAPAYAMVDIEAPPVRHWVDMAPPDRFLRSQLGITSVDGLGARDWVALRDAIVDPEARAMADALEPA